MEPVAPAGACVTGFLRRDGARVESEVSRGDLVRVARIGLVAAIVYVRTLYPSMPRCAHGRRADCVADAVQSPPARRHCEFPPLRATPTGEDAALQGRRRAPRRLDRESGGRRAARLNAHRTGTAVVPHLRHPLLRIWPGTPYVVRAGFCCGLLVQGPGCLSVLQWPPDGTDSCASRGPRHSPGARAAVGDLGAQVIARHACRPPCRRRCSHQDLS